MIDPPSPSVAIVCANCGGARVSRDAWADWDAERQAWVLGTVFEDGFCHRCERAVTLEESPLPDLATAADR